MNPIEHRLSEIEERVKAATPGPWRLTLGGPDEQVVTRTTWAMNTVANFNTKGRHHDNAQLIAHTPTDLSALTKALRVAVSAIEAVASGAERSDERASIALSKIAQILGGEK